MKAFAAVFGAALLAACSPAENEEAVTEEVAVAPLETEADDSVAGRYEVTRSDGYEFTSVINDDGTYSEIVDGAETVRGTWEAKGEQTCYLPEGAAKSICYTFGEPTQPAPEGAFTATSDQGVEHVVRPMQ